MKRSASEAFPVPQAPAFQPNAAALLDPKAYFAQLQQASIASAQAAPAAAAAASSSASAAAAAPQISEIQQQLIDATAVRCAAIVKEKGDNFTTAVQIEALHTMATKSSFKHREELAKQPHVKKLCTKVQGLLRKPPPGIALGLLSKAMWSIARFPEDCRGDSAQVMAPTAHMLAGLPPKAWQAEEVSKILWSLGRTNTIGPHKKLVSQIVQDLVKDRGTRVGQLSHEGMTNLLFVIARARQHDVKGDHRTVHLEANDELFFDQVGRKMLEDISTIDIKLVADVIHLHSEVGLRREPLFRSLCPRIVKDQKLLATEVMAKVIKAYARFMIPLKEQAQGFRTLAIVAKGDFNRPSEKPKFTGKKEYDKPLALFEKPQMAGRG